MLSLSFLRQLCVGSKHLNGVRNMSLKPMNAGESRIPDNSKCINKVILMGRCVGESQRKQFNNLDYSAFVMVTNELRKTKTNELIKRSDFHKVFVYQPFLARKSNDLITKGTRIYLEGKLNYRKFENQFFSNIIAEKIIFISGTNQSYDSEQVNDDIEEADETFVQDFDEKVQFYSN